MDIGQRLASEVGQITALDDKPPSPLPSEEIKRRIAEKAALVAELEARARMERPASPVSPAMLDELASDGMGEPAPRASRITADGRTLAGLMSRAKKLEDAAIALEERARVARENAKEARGYLDTYLRENGLR